MRASAPSRKYLGIQAPRHPLHLRCASSPYSTVCFSRAPCWRGASTLSVHQAIYETVHQVLRVVPRGVALRAADPRFLPRQQPPDGLPVGEENEEDHPEGGG